MSDAWIHRLASALQCLMQFLSISVDLLVPDSSGMLAVKGYLHQTGCLLRLLNFGLAHLLKKALSRHS